MTLRAAILVLLTASAAAGQFAPQPPGPEAATVRGESPQTRKRLAELEQLIRAGKAADAADELQKVLDEAGDDLIAVDARHYAPARRYVHRFLGQLPAAALASYRDRIEEPARRLLDEGRTNRDPQPLRRLLDRYFVSRPAEDALLALGELAFERGEFRAAEGYWRRLLPDAPADDFPYPNPRTDPALVRAKLALAAVFQGDTARANELLGVLREKHPAAAGRLAGRDGKFADTLADVIANPPRLPPAAAGDGAWTTLGGNPARDGRTDGRLSPYWPNRPTWATPLPRDPAADRERYPLTPPPVGAVRSVAFHPVVVGSRAFLADAGRVIGFDLLTGKAGVVYDVRREDPFSFPPGDLKLPVRFDADFALTAAGNTLFARLGPASLFPSGPANQPGAKRASYLVCLDVTDDGVRARWAKAAPAPAGSVAAWEGAALAVGGRVIAPFARSDGGRVVHGLACFDDAGRRQLWAADVSESATGPAGDARRRHELLTLAGPNVVFCSHTGVVAAVDARTGKPAWAFRYPGTRRVPGENRYRDVNPPVAADGRVFVAPTDGDHLYALDAETGRLLWQEGPLAVEQVVGVAGGKVVCTIAGPVRGVRGFDAATGSTLAPRGWAVHDDPGLSSFGRGLLSDEFFIWPTQAGLFVLRLRDGSVARQPIPGPHGNLAFAGGVLLCATPTELWGYLPPERAIPTTPQAAARNALPERAPTPDEYLTAVRAELTAPPADRPPPEVAAPRINVPPAVSQSPIADPPPSRTDPPLELSSRVVTSSRVIARLGERHLVGVDRQTGMVAWVLDALKRPRFDPFAGWPTRRFLPPVYADDAHAVAFTADGRRWVIDAASGAVRHDQPGPAAEFASAVVRIAPDRLAAPVGPGQVVAFDPATGQAAWQYDAGRPPSLMGIAPRVWAAAGSVFVAVTRNVGVEIDRLRPADGGTAWRAGPAFLPAAGIDPAATAADADRLYVPAAGRLVALRLDTGREAWDAALPDDGPWTVHAAANVVIAVRGEALPAEPVAAAVGRVAGSFARAPAVRRLPGLVATLYDAWIDRAVPVLLFDPATGRPVHRLDLPARGPAAAARLSPAGLTVATGRTAYRLN